MSYLLNDIDNIIFSFNSYRHSKSKHDINQTNTCGFIDVTVTILTRSTTFAMSIIVLMSLLHSIKVILLFLPEEEERKI